MSDPEQNRKNAQRLRMIADLMENPEAQAELAEQAVEAGKQQLRKGLLKLIDRIAPKTHNHK